MRFQAFAVPGIPEVRPGDAIGPLVVRACEAAGEFIDEGDIVVVAQKVVSKSEGRFRALADIEPSARAREIARACGKDARKVQAILDESSDILRVVAAPPDGLVIARHKQGWICANAGIDESNLGDAVGQLLLLPLDPDASARRIAEDIAQCTGHTPGIIITDTFGRPWRKGLVNVAIGVARVPPIFSWIGRQDAYGRPLSVSEQAFADEIAAASGLLMVKDASTPVIVFRGLAWSPDGEASAQAAIRPPDKDLFT